MTAREPTRLPVADGGAIWREVRALSLGHRGALVLVVVTGLAGAGAGLLIPAAIGHLVDSLVAGSATVATWAWASTVMIVASLALAGLNAISVRLAARAYQTMLARLRERLVARAMRLPQSQVEEAGTGDLISRSSDDVAEIGDAAPQLIPAFTTAIFATVATLVGVPAVDGRYALAFVGMAAIYMVAVRWYLRTAPQIYLAERTAMSGRAQQLIESARGHATIAGLGLADYSHQRVLDASWQVAGPALRAKSMQNMFSGRLLSAQYAGLGVILAIGFFMVQAQYSSVGEATAATLILQRMFLPTTQLLLAVDTVQSVLASLARIVGVIGIPDTPDGVRHTADRGVYVQDLQFAYASGFTVLEDIDLEIPAGGHLAVVGASGAGKTTLAGVIAGIHQPGAGIVTRPEHTVVITQETHVFSGTLRENLTLAAPEASDDQLRAALIATGADELADLLPQSLDTMVGTTGYALTPSQTQQIALTRVLLADPDLAIFDEATAEAGSSHAGLLDRAADAALAGRTGLVIAHRLSQAADCDQILVMAHGRIVEFGTHDELIGADGTYAQLWQAWRQGQALGEANESG
ncbi:MAG: ABC transporter ATP-binding protein [Ancrocorticia sp.]